MSRVRVIIFGVHSSDWMTALSPTAPVWAKLRDVAEVFISPDVPAHPIGPAAEVGTRTVVIPLMEGHAERCPREHEALVASASTIRILGNKSAFADYVTARSLANLCPARFQHVAEVRFPCVVKRVDLNAGYGVAIVHDAVGLAAILQRRPWCDHEVLLQELIPGETEFVTHCVCHGGEILWHVSFAYRMPAPEVVRAPRNPLSLMPVPTRVSVLSALSAILKPLGYSGPCNVDYKFRTNGDIAVFEVNPRMGGSLMRPDKVDLLAGMLACIIDAAELPNCCEVAA